MIPISKPLIDESEIKNVVEVLKSGILTSGEWVRKLEEEFAKYIGVKYAVATTNGTTALDIALKALDVKITPRTKAIIGVHLFGHPFDLTSSALKGEDPHKL